MRFNSLYIIISLLCAPYMIFPQSKGKKKSNSLEKKVSGTDSLKMNTEDKSNFNMQDIESQLLKINYKPNEIIVTVPNPRIPRRTPLKPTDLVEEKNKISLVDSTLRKQPVFVPPQENVPATTQGDLKPQASATEITSTAQVQDSVSISNQSSTDMKQVITDTTNVLLADSSQPGDSIKPTVPQEKEEIVNAVEENPFRKEVQERPSITPDQQLEQTYSELLIQNKENLSNQSPIFIARKELDFPMLGEDDWKKVTREKMNTSIGEQKTLTQKLNQLLKNYYALNNLTQATHSHVGSESVNDSLNREMVKVYYFLGIAHYNSLEMNQAAESFRKVIQIIPDHEPSFKNISMIYQTNKNHGEEIKKLKSAIFSSDNEKK